MIVYLAVITGIDPSYYEAAEIDGATRQQIVHVTLPNMMTMIIVISTLSLGVSWMPVLTKSSTCTIRLFIVQAILSILMSTVHHY